MVHTAWVAAEHYTSVCCSVKSRSCGFLQCKQSVVKFALQCGCRVSYKYFVGLFVVNKGVHFHFTPHGRYELNKLTSLPMCGFIAQLVEQRTGNAKVTGSNPVEALIFFRLPLSNCLNWKIYCDDHSSLSSTTAVQKWIISYTSHRVHFVVVVCLIHNKSHPSLVCGQYDYIYSRLFSVRSFTCFLFVRSQVTVR